MKGKIVLKVGVASVIIFLSLTMACKKRTADVGVKGKAEVDVNQTAEVESILEENEKWTGDFDGMVKRQKIRVLVPYSKTFYFLDGARQVGITYDMVKIFEKWLNEKLAKKVLKVRLVIIPTPSQDLLPGLIEGRGDIAAGNLTITEERKKIVDFSDPSASGTREVVVVAKGTPALNSLDDLSRREIYVRPSSSYLESLKALNSRFKKAGRKPIKIVKADPYLEDEDILEMVNAGIIPITVVDEHLAEPWSKVFENLTIYPNLAVRTGGELGVAFRKNSPKLKKVVNEFIAGHGQGTLLFNTITNRYLKSTKWVKNALAKEDLRRFSKADEFFIKYADQYGFDWLFIAALAYQESGIDQSVRSRAGAVGVMQMLPSTAKDPNVNIPNINNMENNIHAGVKYLRFIRDSYFEKGQMDDANKTLFTMASYNAGAGKIARLRSEAEKTEFDPNVWFRNVEVIAARRIGQETVQYVRNIYIYYTAYRLTFNELQVKRKVKEKELAR
jgi:membrane-bound lytic murein transglycosylase MltF